MVYKVSDLPCKGCPVLAICVGQKIINCTLLLDFLTKYQRIAKFPMWPHMLEAVRETLKGDWCVVGVNDRINYLEKDRKDPNDSSRFLSYHKYELDEKIRRQQKCYSKD